MEIVHIFTQFLIYTYILFYISYIYFLYKINVTIFEEHKCIIFFSHFILIIKNNLNFLECSLIMYVIIISSF